MTIASLKLFKSRHIIRPASELAIMYFYDLKWSSDFFCNYTIQHEKVTHLCSDSKKTPQVYYHYSPGLLSWPSLLYIHGLWTPRKSFFSKIPNFWACADKLEQKFWGHLSILSQNISTHFGTEHPKWSTTPNPALGHWHWGAGNVYRLILSIANR